MGAHLILIHPSLIWAAFLVYKAELLTQITIKNLYQLFCLNLSIYCNYLGISLFIFISLTKPCLHKTSSFIWLIIKRHLGIICFIQFKYCSIVVSVMYWIVSLSVNNRNELLMYFYGLLWKLGDTKYSFHTHWLQ